MPGHEKIALCIDKVPLRETFSKAASTYQIQS